MEVKNTYSLPNGKNTYGLLNYETGYDLCAQKVLPTAKTYVRTENNLPNNGCLVKNIYDLDTISQIYVALEPEVASPSAGFVCHPGIEEVGVILEGYGILEFPDGTTRELKPADTWYFAEGQPHRFYNNSITVLKMMVCHSGPIEKVNREAFSGNYQDNGGWQLKNLDECTQKLAPGFTGDKGDKGHYTSIIFEGNNICVLHPIQKPGSSSPEYDYVSHPNVHELEFCLSGTALLMSPERPYPLDNKIMRYNPPLQPSKCWNNGTEDLRLWVCYSTGKLANVKRIHNHAITFEVQNLEAVKK